MNCKYVLQSLDSRQTTVKSSVPLVPDTKLTIGRDKSSHLRLVLAAVSRHHCTLTAHSDHVTLDLHGRNGATAPDGTFHRAGTLVLQANDVFVICDRKFRIAVQDAMDDGPAPSSPCSSPSQLVYASPKSATSRRISDMLLYRTRPDDDISDADSSSGEEDNERSEFANSTPVVNRSNSSAFLLATLERQLDNLRLVHDSPTKMAQYSLRERLLIRSAVKASKERQSWLLSSPISVKNSATSEMPDSPTRKVSEGQDCQVADALSHPEVLTSNEASIDLAVCAFEAAGEGVASGAAEQIITAFNAIESAVFDPAVTAVEPASSVSPNPANFDDDNEQCGLLDADPTREPADAEQTLVAVPPGTHAMLDEEVEKADPSMADLTDVAKVSKESAKRTTRGKRARAVPQSAEDLTGLSQSDENCEPGKHRTAGSRTKLKKEQPQANSEQDVGVRRSLRVRNR